MSHILPNTSMQDYMGIEFIEITEHKAIAKMRVSETTCQPLGFLNGGAILALGEILAGKGSSRILENTNKIALGTNINASHLKTAIIGDDICAIALLLHKGKLHHIWDVKVYDAKGVLLSVIQVTNTIIENAPNKLNDNQDKKLKSDYDGSTISSPVNLKIDDIKELEESADTDDINDKDTENLDVIDDTSIVTEDIELGINGNFKSYTKAVDNLKKYKTTDTDKENSKGKAYKESNKNVRAVALDSIAISDKPFDNSLLKNGLYKDKSKKDENSTKSLDNAIENRPLVESNESLSKIFNLNQIDQKKARAITANLISHAYDRSLHNTQAHDTIIMVLKHSDGRVGEAGFRGVNEDLCKLDLNDVI